MESVVKFGGVSNVGGNRNSEGKGYVSITIPIIWQRIYGIFTDRKGPTQGKALNFNQTLISSVRCAEV